VKKLLFYAILATTSIACTAVTLELFSWAAFAFASTYDKTDFERRLNAGGEQPAPRRPGAWPGVDTQHVLHPYLGFVQNAQLRKPQLNFLDVHEPVNEFGFFGQPPLRPEDAGEDTVVIGLSGGSVAAELYLYSREAMQKQLARLPEFAGKKLYFVSLALGGMKQPQQLMTLDWFNALGYRFDILINVDGFNEIVLPVAENRPAGVFPFFPRKWHLYTAKAVTPARAAMLAEVADNRRRLDYWQDVVSDSPLRHSNFVLLVYGLYYQAAQGELVGLETALSGANTPAELDYQQRGPTSNGANEQDVLRESTQVWFNSSLAMARACREAGIHYYHFLQPNQYVHGSKPFSEFELENTLFPTTHDFRRFVEIGYPGLVAAGSNLAQQGVSFHDLTGLFAQESRTLYKDACCHLNQVGSDLLAAAIGTIVYQDLATNSSRD